MMSFPLWIKKNYVNSETGFRGQIFVGGPSIADSDPAARGGPAKNRYTTRERMTVICRVTWPLSEGVNLYSRQALIRPRKTNTYAT
jgi:hypothetical protein